MKLIRLSFVFLLTVLLTACSLSLAGDVTPPPGYKPPPEAEAQATSTLGPLYPLVSPDPIRGEAYYTEECAPCHGKTGLGDGPRAVELPNPVGAISAPEVARRAVPAEWFKLVTQGNLERYMPPFQDLTDRQRWDVVAYTLSLGMSGQTIAQGESVYQENCAKCHGEQGKGNGPEASDIKVPLPDFTDQEFMAEKSGAVFFQAITDGSGPDMPPFGDELSGNERWALTEYLRTLTFASTTLGDSDQSDPTPQGDVSGTDSLATPMPDISVGEGFTETVPVSGTLDLGTVSGIVMNMSGGETPAGLPVTLHGFEQMGVVFSETISLGEDGHYLFTEIEMPEGRIFLVTVDYDEVTYGSDVYTVNKGDTSMELPVQLYETTTDSSILSIDRLHFFFEFVGPETIRIVELYIISNPEPHTVIAPVEGEPVLTFTIPPDATNLELQDGALGDDQYVKTDDGFGDTYPIRPGMGNYQIMFSYEMPYKRKLELTRPVDLDTGAVVVLIPEDGIKIKGDAIQDTGTRDVQGVPYHMYSGGDLVAGDELHLTLSGRPAGEDPALSDSSNSNLVIGLGAMGLVLIAAGVWLYRKSQVDGDEMDENGDLDENPDPIPDDPETLMDAILALDDLYREGQLPESAYQQRRSELKARLRDLLDQ